MEQRRIWPLAVLLVIVPLAAGCGKRSDRDKVARVSGRVTYAGQPVTAGRILFFPEDGRRMALSAIDSEGNYALTTFESQDGAFPGKHQVVIDAVRELAPGPKSFDEEIGGVPPKVERLVPEAYADRNSSPLEAEVVDGDNTINFDIPP